MRWRIRPTMRLMRMPAPTATAERPVLVVSCLLGGTCGRALAVPAPICSRVSPATAPAGFSTFRSSFIWASERVFLHLVEERFITDAQVFGGLALVSLISFQRGFDLAAFDDAQDAMSYV